MNNHLFFPLLASVFLSWSCQGQNEKIAGYWRVSFSDSAKYPEQILHFQNEKGGLHLTIDEPRDGTLEIPGENAIFANDSLHYESLWGLFKYDGKFNPADSIIRGIRLVNNDDPSPFIMRRLSVKELLYKIPRVDANGERIYYYSYRAPLKNGDELECGALSEAGVDSTFIFKLVEDILNGKMATIHSLLISKDNKLVVEEYFHNYNLNTPHSLESVTKSFTSALMGIAIDKRIIPGVNELVWPYLKKWDSTQWVIKKYEINIEHLLTMTSGLQWKAFTANEENDDINIYKSPDFIRYILNKDLNDKPGNTFYYNNRLMYLQGKVIEESSGMSVDRFSTKYLFNELGIGYHKWKVYDNGITETGGGLKLIPRDMMKFGLLYLNHGKWKDKQIISSKWIESSTKNQIINGNEDYGYNWWIKTYTSNDTMFDVYYALGHGEQTIMVIPAANTVFVMTAGNYFQKPQRLNEIMRGYILPSLKDYKKGTQTNSDIVITDIMGEYEINENERIKIEIVDKALVASDPSGAKFKLIAKSQGHYIIENSLRELRFLNDETGTTMSAELFVNGERVKKFKKVK